MHTHTLKQHPLLFLPPRYLSGKDPTYVNYMQFSDEVESIFTHKNLEKTPIAGVQQFIPPVKIDLNILSPEEEQILQKTTHRLAERVRSGKKGEGRRGEEGGGGREGRGKVGRGGGDGVGG